MLNRHLDWTFYVHCRVCSHFRDMSGLPRQTNAARHENGGWLMFCYLSEASSWPVDIKTAHGCGSCQEGQGGSNSIISKREFASRMRIQLNKYILNNNNNINSIKKKKFQTEKLISEWICLLEINYISSQFKCCCLVLQFLACLFNTECLVT